MGKYWIITIRMLYLKMLQLFWHHNKCLISGLICKNECYILVQSRAHAGITTDSSTVWPRIIYIFYNHKNEC